MPSQPNIILIITDQQRGDGLSLAGHPVLRTPNLDFIGASGTRFRRAYSEVRGSTQSSVREWYLSVCPRLPGRFSSHRSSAS